MLYKTTSAILVGAALNGARAQAPGTLKS